MTTALLKRHFSPAAARSPGGAVRVLKMKPTRPAPKLSEQTRRTFEFISDPANAPLFTKEAARKAFSHVKV